VAPKDFNDDDRFVISSFVVGILSELGYDPDDQHFQRTGARVTEWLTDLAKNASEAEGAKLLEVVFTETAPSNLVIVGPIAYRSMCAHHMLPVTGRAWVGYLPDDHVCGLSKLERLVEHYARQLTVQERVTNQVADTLISSLKPKGCMVVIKATHGCMTFRGVKNNDVLTTTSAVRGLHETSASARAEFLALMEGR
jgi:GTP cyclohydrolase IA